MDITNNQEKEKLLNQYYDSITNVRHFKEHTNIENEYRFTNYIRQFTKNRKETLQQNQKFQTRLEWLNCFNNVLGTFTEIIVNGFTKIVEHKDNQIIDFDENYFINHSHNQLHYFKNEFPKCIKLNLDSDKYLANEIRLYFLNGIDSMIDFLRDEMLIEIEKSPFYSEIQSIIDNIENSINIKELKLSLKYESKNLTNNESLNFFPEYKKAFSDDFIDCLNVSNNDGTKNANYYETVISRWIVTRNNQLLDNNNLSERIELLKEYLHCLSSLIYDVVEVFEAINNSESSARWQGAIENIINLKLIPHLNLIENYQQIIRHNVSDGNYGLAIKIKDYCLLMFDDITKVIRDFLFINIEICPLNEKFQLVRSKIENAINIHEIKLLDNKKEILQQPLIATKVKSNKELSDFIVNIDNKKEFIKALVNTFKTEIGIDFKILIQELINNTRSALLN